MESSIPKSHRHYSAAEVATALHNARGLLTVAARQLGCSRSTVQRHIEVHASVREALVDAREGLKDHTESKLYDAITAGEAYAICFYLKTQARDRGYVEKAPPEGGSLTVDEATELIKAFNASKAQSP